MAVVDTEKHIVECGEVSGVSVFLPNATGTFTE
jgi:hypothetical protein